MYFLNVIRDGRNFGTIREITQRQNHSRVVFSPACLSPFPINRYFDLGTGAGEPLTSASFQALKRS
jgi:hypothetical protein